MSLDYMANLPYEKSKTVDAVEVYLQNIMELVSESNKWVYKGSQTSPPCKGPFII